MNSLRGTTKTSFCVCEDMEVVREGVTGVVAVEVEDVLILVDCLVGRPWRDIVLIGVVREGVMGVVGDEIEDVLTLVDCLIGRGWRDVVLVAVVGLS